MYNIIEPPIIKKLSICYEQSFSTSCSEYNSFCEWFVKEKNENISMIKKNNLEYLYDAGEDLDKKINAYYLNRNNINNVMKLTDIEYKNKDNFREFIEDLKFEYNYLTSDKIDSSYNYYSNVIAWLELTQEYLVDALENLSKDKLELKDLDIEFQTINSEVDCESSYMTLNLGEIEIW